MRRGLGILAFLAVLANGPGTAAAATPASGSVSSASTETGWTGEVDGTGGPTAYAATGGTQGLCNPPQCDTYTLEVREPAARLELRARTDVDASTIALEVIEPGGAKTYAYQRAQVATFTREQPAPGTYTLRVIASSGGSPQTIPYSGRATLVLAPPPSPDSFPASSEHPRSSPEVGTPTYTAAAAPPLSLRIRADATSPARLARSGMRVRVRCSGGCAAVRLRLVWDHHVIGRLAITRGAEGRAVGTLRVLRRYRRALRRPRKASLSLVAEASASDGRTARRSFGLTLRR